MTSLDGAVAAPEVTEGTAVGGRYVVGRLLGRGAAGEVRAAYDPVLQRGVAVKLLHAEADEGLAPRARFALEAQLAAAISSPHAVAVFDFGEAEGTPYLVMEQMSGRTWADELREGRPTARRVSEVLRAVLAALVSAHASGIWHRDVKPANVMLAADGTAKLGDFGIAKSATTSQVTLTGDVVGSFAYVSPERVSNAPSGPAGDLWAVGVMAYESYAGRRPFEGQTAVAVVHAVLAARHPALGTLRPDLPTQLTDLIERCLSVEPAERPTAEELAAGFAALDLSAFVEEAPPMPVGLADDVGADEATDTQAMEPPPAAHPSAVRLGPGRARRAGGWTTRLRPPSRRQRVGLAALGVAAVLGAGAFAAGSGIEGNDQHAIAKPTPPLSSTPATAPTSAARPAAATASPVSVPTRTATRTSALVQASTNPKASAPGGNAGPGRHGKGPKHHR